MPTTVGKKLRSRKVKLACERRQIELADSNRQNSQNRIDNVSKISGTGNPKLVITSDINNNSKQNETLHLSDLSPNQNNSGNVNSSDHQMINNNIKPSDKHYDTVTSVHDIGQDDHMFYGEENREETTSHDHPLLSFERKLTKIVEVPSKNITRNNSFNDVNEYNSSKV
jgi:hypothetical protein